MAKKTLAKSVKAKGVKSLPKGPEVPVWKGPTEQGITQSALMQFLNCRERFRLSMIEGLRPTPRFNQTIEFGNMWHTCEEEFARTKGADDDWQRALLSYAKGLAVKYRTEQPQVEKWYNVCKLQFPIYLDWWKKHPDVKTRKPLLAEENFNVDYVLPASGRIVALLGKWDGVDLLGKGKDAAVYLYEHKTKGEINEEQIKRQLLFDLQTGFYMTALYTALKYRGIFQSRDSLFDKDYGQVAGVRYNVIRRPLSGGKHSIRPHAEKKTKNTFTPAETLEHYYARLAGLIAEEPEYYFMRWRVEWTKGDLGVYATHFLNPALEQLCDWWEWVSVGNGREPWREGNTLHWRAPYGIWNSLARGKGTPYDDYLDTGSEADLVRTDNLFPEL